MKEIWKAIPDYEGYYEVSDTGKVRSITRTIIDSNGRSYTYKGQEKSPSIVRGYYRIQLSKNGITKAYFIHRLVALAFLPNPNNLPIINHKDENPLNNNVDNLEWCTQEYNNAYGTKNERQSLTKSHPVIMCDKNTHKPIREFINARVAAEHFNGTPSNINVVLKGKGKSAYGYWWKYKD